MPMASAPCRNPVVAPAKNFVSPPKVHLTPFQIAHDLRELVAMGFIEKFRDHRGLICYRSTTAGKKALSEENDGYVA